MAGDTVITVIGNLTADPELRWTQSGAAVADFTVASTPRTYDRNAGEWRDGDTLFMRCSVWRETASFRVASPSARTTPSRVNVARSLSCRSTRSAPPCAAHARRSPAPPPPVAAATSPTTAASRARPSRAAVTAAARVDTARVAPTTAHRPAAPPRTRGALPPLAAPPPSATSPRSKVERSGARAGRHVEDTTLGAAQSARIH